jgi:hypothetical protein
LVANTGMRCATSAREYETDPSVLALPSVPVVHVMVF